MSESKPRKRMSKEEKQKWDVLYEYVRTNILGYDKNQALSKTMVLRLKGLQTNKFIENKNIANTANYSYSVILNTFKYCSLDIKKGLQSNTFRDEKHRFNYILKIVENNINTVYLRMKKAETQKKNVENIDSNYISGYVNTFKPQNNSAKTSKYDDLW